MERKPLGRTGEKIPEIGLGTWRYKGGVEPLRLGLELGATLIDTAEIYGTEEVVGRAIRGEDRDRLFIATKVSGEHLRYDEVIKAARRSLDRLGLDTIDLYQVHWPNPRIPIRETMRAMEELVKRGWIRYIGVSNFSVEQVREAQEALASQEVVANQVEYSLLERGIEEDLLPYCTKEGITIIAYSPLAEGRIVRGEGPGFRLLDSLANKYRKSRAQVALNWLTARDRVVAIPKADKVEHIKENCGASGWRLYGDDVAQLDKAFSYKANRPHI